MDACAGATHGIGTAIARGLAAQGANLVLVVRNRLRAQELAASISNESGVAVDFIIADLSAQADVRAAARQIIKRFPAVHILARCPSCGAALCGRARTAGLGGRVQAASVGARSRQG